MKLGIVGSGMIVETVLGFIDEIGFEQIYICGRESSRQKVEDLAEDFEVDKTFYNYDEFLKSDADIMYIALPNDMHYEYAKKAIAAKKHVIVEKPATITAIQLEELYALSVENDVFFFEAMSIYHMPAFKQLQEDIELVGDLKIVNFNYSQYSSRYNRFLQGEITPVFDAKRFGGALRDLNIYNISAMVGLFGKPEAVSYIANVDKDVDTSGILLADYGNFKVSCIGAKDCMMPGPSTIQGVKGTVCIYPYVNGMTQYDVLFNDNETETKEVDLSDGSHRLFFEFEEFVRIIEEKDREKCEQLVKNSLIVAEIIDNCQ